MKLDYDCVRDILISLESLLQFGKRFEAPSISLKQLSSYNQMQCYSEQNIVYCTQKLTEAGLIKVRILEANNLIYDISYNSITFSGHQYLDSIRSNAVWEKTKSSFLEKGISLTFDLIIKAAPKIALAMLNL
ncbi:DUF2513 domain-containing protein [Anaerotignum sp.]|uniref:DUF2513 domain-containing protein n=1 Tax=Anaerotignum sp. TaxID=2039241 RepID=UPI00289DFD5F|nr:DUF2513 domain-containing protein [Anaerotignum sp.]